MLLPPTAQALLRTLVAAGLDDDAARLAVGLTDAHADLQAARAAQDALADAAEDLRDLLALLEELTRGVAAALDVDWRSEAGAEYGERTDGLHRTATDRQDEAREWAGLLGRARSEAEQAERDAELRVRRAEEGASALLRAMAAA
ncbi:hypothetical protein KW076_03885 [Micrococcus porci]|uniref:hypothetical protein n=1 Tax=Micrococcus porci TaxID=2856555 RepID=UPI001CCB71EE|nr:hypothetical protein [Micrococcus porci]UBH25339.1 hypothetical protein KW076_03885 [Micrococcus porci]